MDQNGSKLPVLVYQMGKVGSQTISASLFKHDVLNISVHGLTWESIHRSEKNGISDYTKSCRAVRTLMDLPPDDIRWRIVTLVRDPVARIISDTFQNGDRFLPHLRGRTDKAALREVLDYLLKKFRNFNEENDCACSWFDRQMKPVFDFDIFELNFDNTSSYQIYETRRARVLLIKLERLSQCCRQAFAEFLGIRDFSLKNANVGMEKPYRKFYKEVNDSVSVPPCDLEKIYSSRYVRHFYSDRDIAGFKQRWTQNAAALPVSAQFTNPEPHALSYPNNFLVKQALQNAD
jgi:hypothetical protein